MGKRERERGREGGVLVLGEIVVCPGGVLVLGIWIGKTPVQPNCNEFVEDVPAWKVASAGIAFRRTTLPVLPNTDAGGGVSCSYSRYSAMPSLTPVSSPPLPSPLILSPNINTLLQRALDSLPPRSFPSTIQPTWGSTCPESFTQLSSTIVCFDTGTSVRMSPLVIQIGVK